MPEPPTASPPTTAPVLALTPSQLDAAVLAPAADEEAVRPWPLPEYDGVIAVDECVWSLAVEQGGLVEHLNALNSYLLLGNGEFTQA